MLPANDLTNFVAKCLLSQMTLHSEDTKTLTKQVALYEARAPPQKPQNDVNFAKIGLEDLNRISVSKLFSLLILKVLSASGGRFDGHLESYFNPNTASKLSGMFAALDIDTEPEKIVMIKTMALDVYDLVCNAIYRPQSLAHTIFGCHRKKNPEDPENPEADFLFSWWYSNKQTRTIYVNGVRSDYNPLEPLGFTVKDASISQVIRVILQRLTDVVNNIQCQLIPAVASPTTINDLTFDDVVIIKLQKIIFDLEQINSDIIAIPEQGFVKRIPQKNQFPKIQELTVRGVDANAEKIIINGITYHQTKSA
jgi:hypothetical protein